MDLYKEQFSLEINQVVKEKVLKSFPKFFFAIVNEKLLAPITQEELKHVTKSMVTCKSPSPNGVGVKYFKFFWTYLVKITRG